MAEALHFHSLPAKAMWAQPGRVCESFLGTIDSYFGGLTPWALGGRFTASRANHRLNARVPDRLRRLHDGLEREMRVPSVLYMRDVFQSLEAVTAEMKSSLLCRRFAEWLGKRCQQGGRCM